VKQQGTQLSKKKKVKVPQRRRKPALPRRRQKLQVDISLPVYSLRRLMTYFILDGLVLCFLLYMDYEFSVRFYYTRASKDVYSFDILIGNL
jgi:hypothetical protein